MLYPTYVLRSDKQLLKLAQDGEAKGVFNRTREPLVAEPTRAELLEESARIASIRRAFKQPGVPINKRDYIKFKRFLAKNILENKIFKHSDLLIFFDEAVQMHQHLRLEEMRRVISELCEEIELFRAPSMEEIARLGTPDSLASVKAEQEDEKLKELQNAATGEQSTSKPQEEDDALDTIADELEDVLGEEDEQKDKDDSFEDMNDSFENPEEESDTEHTTSTKKTQDNQDSDDDDDDDDDDFYKEPDTLVP